MTLLHGYFSRFLNCTIDTKSRNASHMALNNLNNNKNIVIQKSDKGNSVVLLDKDKYLKAMTIILNNNAKFERLQFDHDKELNYLLNLEKKCSERS